VETFTVLDGVAVPLRVPNVNTDVLIRIERLTDLAKGQLGPYCFEAWRYDRSGNPLSDFILNQPAYQSASILIAGRNFGCGSSREGAVWALRDMGFRCILAQSFGDIFFNNCLQNGVLALALPVEVLDNLAGEALEVAGAGSFRVDLIAQRITTPAGRVFAFDIDAPRRLALLQGLDEISMTLSRESQIAEYQQRDRLARPWIYALD
jgi:3-isopropylmalate/(R)-2-methylmalate dehydratase small subunit